MPPPPEKPPLSLEELLKGPSKSMAEVDMQRRHSPQAALHVKDRKGLCSCSLISAVGFPCPTQRALSGER